jgi:hypothetical protein
MDLSLHARPEAVRFFEPNGASVDTPLRSWPLSRRSGRFPAVPYPPLRPSAFYARFEMLIASLTIEGVQNLGPEHLYCGRF